MGSTNFTPHYDIPLPLGSDKTTPMDYNTSMQAVDTALFEAQGNASDAKQSVTALTQDLAQTNDNVNTLAGRVTTAEGTISSQGTAINNLGNRINGVEADAQDMVCAYKEDTATASRNYAVGDYFIYNDVLYRATQAINSGNTIVPDTNCTTTNVTSEIKNVGGDLSAYQTKQDNALETNSKQVVGAINEVNSDLTDLENEVNKGSFSKMYGGSTTYGSMLSEFKTHIDTSKINVHSILVMNNIIFHIDVMGATMVFTVASVDNTSGSQVQQLSFGGADSFLFSIGGTTVDKSNDVLPAETTLTLYY